MQPNLTVAYANANIALVKYWGKQDHALNIPAVSSLSMTLDGFGTTVTIGSAQNMQVSIDDVPASADVHERVGAFIKMVRARHTEVSPLTIASTSNLPYAAGLASSAAFYASLTAALNHHFSLGLSLQECSMLARLGSASAARSMFGGLCALYGGPTCGHEQAYAAPLTVNPKLNLVMIIAVVSTKPKTISSRQAMNNCQQTSPFFPAFVDTHHKDFADAIDALHHGAFETLGTIMEHSTLKMFATMWTAQPAIIYWQEPSLSLINLVYHIRQEHGPIAYFTMDAGPQVKILTQQHHAEKVLAIIKNSGLTQGIYYTKPGDGATIVTEPSP